MTTQEIAAEMTKAWTEKAGPKTWYQVAEAYTGILEAINQSNADTAKAAKHFSDLSVAAQRAYGRQELQSLTQLEEAASKKKGEK